MEGTRETHFKHIYKVVIIYEELYLSYPQGLSWLLTFTSHFFKRYLLLLLIWWYFICKQNYLFKSHLHSRLCSTGVFKIHLESLIDQYFTVLPSNLGFLGTQDLTCFMPQNYSRYAVSVLSARFYFYHPHCQSSHSF